MATKIIGHHRPDLDDEDFTLEEQAEQALISDQFIAVINGQINDDSVEEDMINALHVCVKAYNDKGEKYIAKVLPATPSLPNSIGAVTVAFNKRPVN